MKVFDNVKEHRKILDLEVKCMNTSDFPPCDGRYGRYPVHVCPWTGELRVHKVTLVWEYIYINCFAVCQALFCAYLSAFLSAFQEYFAIVQT